MNGMISWWVLALVVGISCPLWLRVLVDRWRKQAEARTQRLLGEVQASAETHDAPMS